MFKIVAITSLVFCATAAAAQTANHTRLLEQFRGSSEKTAKDAVWTKPNIFKVGVIDNGSNRDGYASYVCEEAASAGLKDITVQIIDVAKLKQTGKWVKLGEKRCP